MSDIRMGSSNVFTSTLGIKFADGTTQITAAEGTGDAVSIQNIAVSPTPPDHNGQLLIYDSVSHSYVPGDPLVQGLFPEGTATSGINPILVAGRGADGLQHSLSVDNSGVLNVNASFGGTVSQNLTEWANTVLGVPTPYGTAPSTGNYLGVNAFVTNTIPVTGTFWQATQPVSVASLPLPAGAATETTLASLDSKTPVLVGGSIPITGTFWQATQPVSIATMPTTPVTGTFWQTTQPVSGAISFTAPQHVIVDAGGGGGAQFAMGSAQAVSALGTIALGYDGTDVRGLLVSSTGQLHTIIDSSSSISVTQDTSPWVVSLASTTITGTVAVTGTFWQATQPVSGTFWQATQPISGAISFTAPQHVIVDSATLGTVAVSGTFWQATQPVSGTVAISGTIPVSGTFWPYTLGQQLAAASVPVVLTAAQLSTLTPLSTVAVTGTFWQATQPVSGSVSVSNFPATQPISGTVTANQGTSPWVVSLASTTITGSVAVTGTFWQATQPISGAISFTVPQHVIIDSATLGTVAVSGTFWQATQPVSIASAVAVTQSTSPWIVAGGGTAGVSGTAVLTVQGIAGGTALPVSGTFWQTTQPVSGAISFTAPQHVIVDSATLGTVAVSGTFWQATQPVSLASTTITGTVAVTQSTSPWIVAGGGTAGVSGTAVLTVQGIAGGTALPVSGTFWQTTQPVSLASTTITGTVAVTQSTSPWVVSLASTTITGSVAVTGSFWQATQPVSIATMPTTPVTGVFWQTTQPVSLASTTITGTVAVTQSTSPWIVAGGGTAGVPGTAVLTVQGIAGGTPLPVSGTFWQATQPVSGTFWQATQPISGAISFTVPQHVIVDSATLGTVAVSGTFWQAVQPISGTVTANVGTTGGLALDATLTGGTAKFEMYDGTNVLGTTLHPVKVDGSGVTQPVSGTFWQATQPISGSVSVSNFPATQPISGTVTALQGTSPWVVSLASTTITGSVAVTGTFWQATQPISGAISFTAPQHVIVDSATLGTVAVSGTFWQATQPVSIASMPSTPVTGTFWPYTLGQQLSANSVPVVLTAAQLSTLTPLSSVSITGSVAVTGTFWQATQPVSIAAPVDVSDRAARLLGHVTVDNASIAVTGTFWQAIQPVSGTVTANQGTSPWVVSLASTTITGTVDVSDRAARLLGHVTVDNASIAVTGTFWQAIQPVSGTVTANQGTSPWIVAGGGTAGVSGTAVLTVQGIAGGTALPVSGTFWQATQPVSGAISFTAPQHVITDTTSVTNATLSAETTKVIGTVNQGTSPWVVSLASTTITGNVTVIQPTGTNLHTVIDSGTLTTVSTVTAVTAITNALPVGANTIGKVDILGNAGGILDTVKGTQSATAVGVQELKDAGRNMTNYFMAAPIITTTAEVMQSLTGYKSGAAVVATATPAVVTAGKTYRIQSVEITYWSATVVGGARINLRANLTGVGVVGSPLVKTWQVGVPAVFSAGVANTYTFNYPDGLEFAAGTGIAIGVIGEGAVPTTGTITGYVLVAINGYEY